MEIKEEPLIQALTRPATICGLTYNYFVLLLMFCLIFTFYTKLYIISLILNVFLYIGGRWLVKYDHQWLDGFITLIRYCRPQKNRKYWGCRSYAPW